MKISVMKELLLLFKLLWYPKYPMLAQSYKLLKSDNLTGLGT